MENLQFDSMGLRDDLIEAIKNKGFNNPTPIQVKSIPLALTGKDIMGQAQTGTGKTASFGIPMLNKIKRGSGFQALVLCPTRELAIQVAHEINSIGREIFIRALPIYGGQSIGLQINELKRRPEIIVSTPGRLLDHMNRRTISLKTLKFVVLDEADEMLDMGFLSDIETILHKCPVERQTMLFSATLPIEIRQLAQKFMDNPELVAIKPQEKTVALISQSYYEVNPRFKLETLCRILENLKPSYTLVFCRTKKSCDEIAIALKTKGFRADALHGDMSQRERDNVMNRFRRGNVGILVATDLAARGLDVDIVTHVINYDIPEDPDSYVHRIGRTGRAGRQGVAITLTEPGQYKKLRFIENHISKRIRRDILPSNNMHSLIKERLVETQNRCSDIHKKIAEELISENDATMILAAAIKLIAGESIAENPLNREKAPLQNINKVKQSSNVIVDVEIPVGRNDGVTLETLIKILLDNTKLNKNEIGEIEVNSRTSFVGVPIDYVDEVYRVCSQLKSKVPKRNHQNFKTNNYIKTKVNV